VPVIVAIHGYCYGGAIDLASACDIRLSTKDAKMSIKEVDIGSVADFGTLQRFGRKVGNGSWFRELAYSSREFTPQEAKKHGYLNGVYDTKEDLYKAAYELANTIAAKSPVAVVGSKISMNYSQDHSTVDGLSQIKYMNSALLQSSDTATAAMASLSKQVPKFAKL
jgi:enoyl-CoA hydratase/carnithine racemase